MAARATGWAMLCSASVQEAQDLALIAHAGHPCGEDFVAAPFLSAHPEYSYLKPVLKDMPSGPWTKFSAAEKK